MNYTRDRQPRWVELDIQPLKDATGRVTGFMSLELDITERKRIQAESARKEAEFRFIFESAPLGLSWLWVGADGSRRRLTNEAHLRIIGLTHAQMNDPTIFRRITHPDDWVRQQELYEKLEQGEVDRFSVRKRYRRLDGTEVIGELTFHRFRDAAGGYQEVSTLVDVTPLVKTQEELAAKEAQFRFIFEAAPIGISWRRIEADGAIVRLINDAHLRLCGLTREEASLPNCFAGISDPAEYAAQQEQYRRLVAGEITQFSIEKRYLHRDGSVGSGRSSNSCRWVCRGSSSAGRPKPIWSTPRTPGSPAFPSNDGTKPPCMRSPRIPRTTCASANSRHGCNAGRSTVSAWRSVTSTRMARWSGWCSRCSTSSTR
jgi:PAS domain S-box-containing protein